MGTVMQMHKVHDCMGNQTRVADNVTVISTSTRNFPYMEAVKRLEPMADEVYKYLSFDPIAEYKEIADRVIAIKVA